MIIDFHTHSFPDAIAQKALQTVSFNGCIPTYRDGTLSSLKTSAQAAGIDCCVLLPVATSPRSVQKINKVNAAINGIDGMVFAGCIHPDCEEIEKILDDMVDYGFFGLKIHPDNQGVDFDDPRMVRIMREAAKRDLMTVTHAGFDVSSPDHISCSPDMVLHVLDELGGIIDNKLILAHLGSITAPDEVLEKLCGTPVYMDTGVVLDRNPDIRLDIIRKHGPEKILFASDSPWADQKKYVSILNQMELSDKEKTMIFEENARTVLRGKSGVFPL